MHSVHPAAAGGASATAAPAPRAPPAPFSALPAQAPALAPAPAGAPRGAAPPPPSRAAPGPGPPPGRQPTWRSAALGVRAPAHTRAPRAPRGRRRALRCRPSALRARPARRPRSLAGDGPAPVLLIPLRPEAGAGQLPYLVVSELSTRSPRPLCAPSRCPLGQGPRWPGTRAPSLRLSGWQASCFP